MTAAPVPPADPAARRVGLLLPAVLAGVVAGTAAQVQQVALWQPAAYGVLLAAALSGLVLAWRARAGRRARVPMALCALAAALAAFAGVGLRAGALQAQAQALDPAIEGRDVVLTGLVSRMPQRGEMGWRFRFDVEAAQIDGQPVAVPPRVQLAWYGSASTADETDAARPLAAELRAGDRWQFTARLKAPHGNLNPHGFDYELWLWEQGVRATGYVRAGPRDAPPRRLGEAAAFPIERARQSVRDRILAGGAGQGDEGRRFAGIVAALVTGDQAVIERADWDIFRATGVAHLMSISGLHITMFAWLAAALVGGLWRRSARWGLPARLDPCLLLPAPHAALIGGVLLAGAYALFSGWGVPAQRTVLMLATVSLLKLAGVRWPWWLTWLLACAVVLLADPWALLQAGFWLSFVAVGVLFATDSGATSALQTGARGHFVRLLREQWVVTLALTPLSLILFGQASVVGLLANLLAIPWVTLVVTPLAMLGMAWAPLWQAAAWALQPLAALLQWLASWPGASVSLASAPLPLGVAAVGGALLLALRWPWALRVAGLPLVLPLLLWQPARPVPGQFELLAADVGQGNAVLVRTATHTLVYDAGPRYSLESDAGHRVLVPLLRALGERVDTLVLSHRDSDHTGGAGAVLAMQRGAALLSSIEEGHELQGARTAMRCQAGQAWDWDGVRFELLHPAAADYGALKKSNAMSCVLRVQGGGRTALLVGDIEAEQERVLVAAHGNALRANVLLVPHHGSRTSSTPDFVDAVRPDWALIQSGYRNRFGHPVPDVLARYTARGVRVADSPRCGAMRWNSAQPDALRCERAHAARYWHHRLP
ncbi:DNA internalization-related competence protein ComEC/Rec2 [Ottowia sp.]|uniref:DNA internalization-related competence protein ComEC/Rec2 n=1 Tax=Ottowia sp. TaxID=1898956 RepID=UPI002C8282C1|nr:DNA internalization-related competence protein ComEC/Rec2 [Ottowia sp.]HOB67492.1 DNA internalization-related competence protein ComEC/Rec2 [Ottowia sp.]HPZ57735.1 DNA internalization-related competence protein ComEC/Rec2 [Ottowia sp.]HQD48059.1 DNA internalization-related competence protein ComEC/Rec2 [Ottowia sp.]